METIQFNAVVGEEQVIRPPLGVRLPEGEIEVTVRAPKPPAMLEQNFMRPTRERLLAMATEAERLKPNLPSDIAERHDHYAHGKRLP